MRKPRTADFAFCNNGSIWLVEPQNRTAQEHLESNLSGEAQHWGKAVVVETRYVADLAARLQGAGFTVADSASKR